MNIVMLNNAETMKNKFVEIDDSYFNVKTYEAIDKAYSELKRILKADDIEILKHRMIMSYTLDEKDNSFVCIVAEKNAKILGKPKNKFASAMYGADVFGDVILCKYDYTGIIDSTYTKGFNSIKEAQKYFDDLFRQVEKYIQY